MDWGMINGAIASIIALSAAAHAWYKARADRKLGVSGIEQVDRRDTIADRDALIERLSERLTALEKKVDVLQADLDHEKDYNRLLVNHIYRELGPPPPARPARS